MLLLRPLLLLYLLLWLTMTPVFAQDTLRVTAENTTFVLSESQLLYQQNPSNQIADILQQDSLFISPKSNILKLGAPKDESIWIKFKLKKQYNKDLYLLLYPSNADTIILYSLNRENQWQIQRTGRLLSFKERAIPLRYHTLKLPSSQDTLATFYVHIKASFPASSRLLVCDRGSIVKNAHGDDILNGIFWGMILLIFFINVLMYITSKEQSYIWYGLYLLIISSMIGLANSFFHECFFYNTPQYNHRLLIFANIGSLFAGFFTVTFLDMRVKLPKMFRLMRWVFRGYIILFILGLFNFVLVSLFGSLILAMIAITLGIIAAIKLFDKKNYAIIFYLIGWAVLGISISIYIPLSLGSVEPRTEPNHIFYIGLLLDSLLMTLAIFFRVSAMRQEKDEANANMLQTLREKEQLVFEQNQLLEHSVSIRTEELQLALEREQDREEKVRLYTKKLEISNQELMDFAHIVSHDLRAPLRNITAFTDLLKRRNLTKFDERDNEFMNFIIRNAKQAMQLVEDLLSFARVDKNLPEPKPVDLKHLVENINAELKVSVGQQRNVHLILKNYLPTIQAHASILNVLFKSLILNGIKFNTSECATIEIGASKLDKKDIFWVRDNGIGIPPQYHQEVFTMFTRLHNTDKYEGSGIGLSICRKIVTIYGGDIWLSSEEGKGSTFFFTLPKAEVLSLVS